MERNAYFDNCKAILILLVVLGHLIEPWIDTVYSCKSLYLFIYSFHIPMFVFVSGYFAKYIKDYSGKELKYLALFLVFTILYWPLSGHDLLVNLVMPYWILWYLISLVSWYVLIQFFTRLKHPILLSVIIAVAAGYIDQIGYAASLSRTLVFFPFFLAGYYFSREYFTLIKKPVAMLILMVCLVASISYGSAIDYHWLYGAYSYAILGFPQWFAGFYRLALYGATCVIGAAFLSLIPTNRTVYTRLGQYTLWIFLFHGVFIKLWRWVIIVFY